VNPSQTHSHPNFSSTHFSNDIGVIELAQRVLFDDYKQPAALVATDADLTRTMFNVTGWGTLSEGDNRDEFHQFLPNS
jgi:hypothetical protein